MHSLESIISLTKELRIERDELALRVSTLNYQLSEIQNRLMPGIRNKVGGAAEKYSILHAAIDQSRSLFVKPRSIVTHGYRIGLRKGKGAITIDDPDRTLLLVEKHFPDRDLIQTKKTLDRKALSSLDVSELKKVGCAVEATGDVVFIQPTDTAVDKIVKALLKSATESVADSPSEAASERRRAA